MVRERREAEDPGMDVVLWILTGFAFLGLLAAVPIALRESRQDELEIRTRR